jgi:hypothetical protein
MPLGQVFHYKIFGAFAKLWNLVYLLGTDNGAFYLNKKIHDYLHIC